MTTATQFHTSNPITPVGTEKIVGDDAGGITGGMLSQAIADLFKGTKGTDIASAATTNIGAATGMYVHVTGTATITAFDNVAAGLLRFVEFAGALLLTYNATSLILPTGANITTAAGDTATFISEGSGNWRCIGYQRASGAALALGAATEDLDLNGHKLVNVADPTAPTDGVNLETLQLYLAKMDSKPSCYYAETGALPSNTYSNGSSGVGATLTGTANGPLIIDGVTLDSSDVGKRMLVAGEATHAHNGWYTLTQLGVVSVSPYVLTRAVDSDEASDIAPGYITSVKAPAGSTGGVVNDGVVFISLCAVPFVVGTDSLTFAPIGTSSSFDIHGLSSKSTPVDADEMALADSAASWALKKFTGANLKAYLKTYFDTLYAGGGGGGGSVPLASAFTVLGPCTLADKTGRLVCTATQQINQLEGGYQAIPTAPYTIDVEFDFAGVGALSGGGCRAGLLLSDGTGYLAFYMGTVDGSRVIALDYWDHGTNFNSVVSRYADATRGETYKLRITDDGTGASDARKYWISSNKKDFVVFYSSSNTATFTPTTCGFVVYDYGNTQPAKMSILDWTLTSSVLGDAA